MSRRRSARICALLTLAVLAPALAACDELSGTADDELDPDLIGEWIAISGPLVSTQNASDQVDLITDVGGFTAVTLNADGSMLLVEYDIDADQLTQETAGWSTSGGELTIEWSTDPPETLTYEIRSDGKLMIHVGEGDTWDFDGDGTEEPGDLSFIFASGDGNPDPDLVATWAATSFTFTSSADPSVSTDLIAEGSSFEITFADGLTYNALNSFPDGQGGTVDEAENGVFIGLEGRLWITESTETTPDLVLYTVSGNTAVVTSQDDSYDFTDDGIDDPATLEIQLTRQ